ncbi:MAG TPA: hypothetical protein VN829_20385, partial [Dongiaceae bacterium]|nr:hypothetical protein [Dongiaceae bacterium]
MRFAIGSSRRAKARRNILFHPWGSGSSMPFTAGLGAGDTGHRSGRTAEIQLISGAGLHEIQPKPPNRRGRDFVLSP